MVVRKPTALAVLVALLGTSCSMHRTAPSGHAPSAEEQAYSRSLIPIDPTGLGLELPSSWTAQAWHVPDEEVQAIRLSPDGETIFWGRADPYRPDAEIKLLVGFTAATRRAQFFRSPHSVLEFSPLGDGIVELEAHSAPDAACVAPPCEQQAIVHLGRDGGARTITSGAVVSTSGSSSALSPSARGVVFQLPGQQGFDTYVLNSPAAAPVMVRSDTVPSVALTVAGDQVVGQFFGQSGFWNTPASREGPRRHLPASMQSGSDPSGGGAGLAWARHTRQLNKVLVITAVTKAQMGAGRVVPASEDFYNALWVDDCHMAEREADGFYLLTVCKGSGPVLKTRLLSDARAGSLFNPARFDARAGKILLAFSPESGKGIDIVLLDTQSESRS